MAADALAGYGCCVSLCPEATAPRWDDWKPAATPPQVRRSASEARSGMARDGDVWRASTEGINAPALSPQGRFPWHAVQLVSTVKRRCWQGDLGPGRPPCSDSEELRMGLRHQLRRPIRRHRRDSGRYGNRKQLKPPAACRQAAAIPALPLQACSAPSVAVASESRTRQTCSAGTTSVSGVTPTSLPCAETAKCGRADGSAPGGSSRPAL